MDLWPFLMGGNPSIHVTIRSFQESFLEIVLASMIENLNPKVGKLLSGPR